MTFLQIIYDNAYLILLFAASMNSAVVAILGGIAAHAGHLSLWMEMIILVVGSKFFMQIYFHIGQRGAQYFQQSSKAEHPKIKKILRLIEKHNHLYILAYRFLPGLRFLSPYIIGMTHIKTKDFILWDTLGAIIWGVTFTLIGYLCGSIAMHVFHEVKHYENIAFIIVIAIAVIWALWRWLRYNPEIREYQQKK